jgi:hypothetical protein
VLAQQERIERGDAVQHLQGLAVGHPLEAGVADQRGQQRLVAALADEGRAAAQAQVVAVDRQQDLGGRGAVALELLDLVLAQPVLDEDGPVQQRVLEHRLLAMLGLVAHELMEPHQVEHAAGGRRVLQAGQASDRTVAHSGPLLNRG